MLEQNIGHITISYTDGTIQRFEYSRAEDMVNLVGLIEDILNSNQLAIEADGNMLIIPMQNIKTIEISPAPEKMPRYVIRNTRLVEAHTIET
ncbi:MAG: hypothetical protein ACYS8Z_23420 [Planctomycetota bacterium]